LESIADVQLENEVNKQMKKFTRSVMLAPCVLGLLVGVRSAHAAAGDLDPTFGNGGVTTTSLGSSSDALPLAVKVLSDGKILVSVLPSVTSSNELLRYTSNGALDNTFGHDGVALVIGPSISIQSNGQIVVGSALTDPSTEQQALAVQRLNADGAPDTSFGKAGIALTDLGDLNPLAINSLALPDGDILICGLAETLGRHPSVETALARFNSDGELDQTFGNQGVELTTAAGCGALAVLSNGDILDVAGEAIAQFTANGSIESTVTAGTIVASNGSIGFEPLNIFETNGDYLLGLTSLDSRLHESAAQVLRFTETGSLDHTFANPTFHFVGNGGSGIEASVSGLAVQSNEDIVVAGGQEMFSQSGVTGFSALARLTPSGHFDPTFGNAGIVINSAGGSLVAIQPPDGKIITVGLEDNNTTLVVSRFLAQ
jgi:uncharacterized delta-60 repeat protein